MSVRKVCVVVCVCVSVFLYIEVYTHIRMDSVYVDAKPFYMGVLIQSLSEYITVDTGRSYSFYIGVHGI